MLVTEALEALKQLKISFEMAWVIEGLLADRRDQYQPRGAAVQTYLKDQESAYLRLQSIIEENEKQLEDDGLKNQVSSLMEVIQTDVYKTLISVCMQASDVYERGQLSVLLETSNIKNNPQLAESVFNEGIHFERVAFIETLLEADIPVDKQRLIQVSFLKNQISTIKMILNYWEIDAAWIPNFLQENIIPCEKVKLLLSCPTLSQTNKVVAIKNVLEKITQVSFYNSIDPKNTPYYNKAKERAEFYEICLENDVDISINIQLDFSVLLHSRVYGIKSLEMLTPSTILKCMTSNILGVDVGYNEFKNLYLMLSSLKNIADFKSELNNLLKNVLERETLTITKKIVRFLWENGIKGELELYEKSDWKSYYQVLKINELTSAMVILFQGRDCQASPFYHFPVDVLALICEHLLPTNFVPPPKAKQIKTVKEFIVKNKELANQYTNFYLKNIKEPQFESDFEIKLLIARVLDAIRNQKPINLINLNEEKFLKLYTMFANKFFDIIDYKDLRFFILQEVLKRRLYDKAIFLVRDSSMRARYPEMVSLYAKAFPKTQKELEKELKTATLNKVSLDILREQFKNAGNTTVFDKFYQNLLMKYRDMMYHPEMTIEAARLNISQSLGEVGFFTAEVKKEQKRFMRTLEVVSQKMDFNELKACCDQAEKEPTYFKPIFENYQANALNILRRIMTAWKHFRKPSKSYMVAIKNLLNRHALWSFFMIEEVEQYSILEIASCVDATPAFQYLLKLRRYHSLYRSLFFLGDDNNQKLNAYFDKLKAADSNIKMMDETMAFINLEPPNFKYYSPETYVLRQIASNPIFLFYIFGKNIPPQIYLQTEDQRREFRTSLLEHWENRSETQPSIVP